MYIRYSTDKQDRFMQEGDIREFARKYECQIVKVYVEPGVSATKTSFADRNDLQQMLQDALDNTFDFVAVYKADRLARDPIDHDQIRTAMRGANKPIVITSTFELYDEQDVIVRLTKDGITAFESALISERTRDTLRSIIRRGGWGGGKAPYGYRYNKHTREFSKIPEERIVVKQIFELYIKGIGCKKIAERLPKGSYYGKDWARQQVECVIRNPFYAGYMVWGKSGTNTKGLHLDNPQDDMVVARYSFTEPTVTREDWERCWKQLNLRSKRTVDPKHLQTTFLLRGLSHCWHGSSGEELEPRDQRTKSRNGKIYGTRVYRCPRCHTRYDANALDQAVIVRLRVELKTRSDSVVALLKQANDVDARQIQAQMDDLRTQRTQYAEKEHRITELMLERYRQEQNDRNHAFLRTLTLYRMDLNRRILEIDSQIKTLLGRLSLLKTVESQDGYWQAPAELLNKAFEETTTMEWRRLITEVVDSVSVKPDGSVNITFRWGETAHLANYESIQYKLL